MVGIRKRKFGEPREAASGDIKREHLHNSVAVIQTPFAILSTWVSVGLVLSTDTVGVGVGRFPDESGQTRDQRIVVGPESVVGYVHVGHAPVDVVAAVVEPPGDVLAVRLGGYRLVAVRRRARREGRAEDGFHLLALGLKPLQIFLVVGGGAALGQDRSLQSVPAPLRHLGVVLGAEVTEDLESLH